MLAVQDLCPFPKKKQLRDYGKIRKKFDMVYGVQNDSTTDFT